MLDSDLQHPPELIPPPVRGVRARPRHRLPRNPRSRGGHRLVQANDPRAFYRLLNRLSGGPDPGERRGLPADLAQGGNLVFRTQIRERNQFLRGLVRLGPDSPPRPCIKFEVRPRGGGGAASTRCRAWCASRFAGITSFSKKAAASGDRRGLHLRVRRPGAGRPLGSDQVLHDGGESRPAGLSLVVLLCPSSAASS